jgi:hypothetical protein
MPPRIVTAAVVLLWLASSAWLYLREIHPLIATGEPPRFALAHDDDKKQERLAVTWTAAHETTGKGQKPLVYRIQSSVVHHDKNREDLFELVSHMRPAADQKQNFLEAFHLSDLETTYRVRRDGRMTGFKAAVQFNAGLAATKLSDQFGEFDGEVRGDRCRVTWAKKNAQASDGGKLDVEVSMTGSVLLPLHPLERMPGLRPGKRWGQFLLDPLDRASIPSDPPRLVWVEAEVREKLEVLRGKNQRNSCRVVDVKGGNGYISGSVWVETESGQDKVLRVRVKLGDDTWTIRRGYDADTGE